MIVSHSHKFILLSINKVATTTSHDVLSQFVLEGDVTTGFHDETDQEFLLDESSKPQNVPEVTYNEFASKSEVQAPYMPKYVGDRSFTNNPNLEALLSAYDEETILNTIAKATFKHATPTELVSWGLVTEDQLFEYNVYAFIRDPIQRTLSSYFFEQFVHKKQPTAEDVISWIDGLDENGPFVFLNKKYRNYFEYQGKRIAYPLKFDNYGATLAGIVEYHGGIMPDVLPTYKSKCRPEWSKQPINTWLPKQSIDKLENVLEEDIRFFNEN